VQRRAFLVTLAGGIVVAPLAVEAQPAAKVYRIGFLSQGQPPKAFLEALQQGLRERGLRRRSKPRLGIPVDRRQPGPTARNSPRIWRD